MPLMCRWKEDDCTLIVFPLPTLLIGPDHHDRNGTGRDPPLCVDEPEGELTADVIIINLVLFCFTLL